MKTSMHKETPFGFTRFEALVVGGIIALLLLTTGVMVSSARTRARDYKRLADMARVQAALELYFNDTNRYPSSEGARVVLGGDQARCLGADGFQPACATSTRSYLNPVPSQTAIGLSNKDVREYVYESDGESYVIGLTMERAIPQANLLEGLMCARPGTLTASRGGVCVLRE